MLTLAYSSKIFLRYIKKGCLRQPFFLIKIIQIMTNIKYFIKLFTFWLFYFFIDRLLFIGFYFEEFSGLTSNELLTIIPKSLKLDLSFIAYLSSIITLLLFINSTYVNQILNRIINKAVLSINIFFILNSSNHRRRN